MFPRWPTGGVALLLLSIASLLQSGAVQAQSGGDQLQSAEILWSIPQFAMLDLTQSSDGTIFILAQDKDKEKSLLVGPNESGPGRRFPLTNSKSLSEAKLRLVAGLDDSLWVWATKNYRRSAFGSLLSDGYLAKIDREGHVEWDTEIARNHETAILDVAPLSSGDVVIVGREDENNWLARFSKDGQKSWEKTFGLGKIASVAVAGDVIVVAAFEVDDPVAGKGQSHIALWWFGRGGELLGRQQIRDDVATSPNSLWLLKVIWRLDSFYVFSAWTEHGRIRDLQSPLPLPR